MLEPPNKKNSKTTWSGVEPHQENKIIKHNGVRGGAGRGLGEDPPTSLQHKGVGLDPLRRGGAPAEG